jgi:protein TonB
VVFGPPPRYPEVALRQRKQGTVLLAVVIAPDGRAQDVRVVGSSGFAPLDASAVTAVRERFRFAPERRGDTAVESSGTLVIRFELRDAGQG